MKKRSEVRCWACVQGRGKNNPPPSATRREGDPGGTRACIVARDVDTRMTLATMPPSKSGDQAIFAKPGPPKKASRNDQHPRLPLRMVGKTTCQLYLQGRCKKDGQCEYHHLQL